MYTILTIDHYPQLKYHGRYKGVASLEIEGGPGLSPINIGIIVSCSLIGLVILIQVGSQNIYWSQVLQ